MKRFRDVIFWAHLAAGILAGVVIFIMCVTGALLAFDRQTIELFQRDARWVTVQPGAERLGPVAVFVRLAEARPLAKPSAIAIRNEGGPHGKYPLGATALSSRTPTPARSRERATRASAGLCLHFANGTDTWRCPAISG